MTQKPACTKTKWNGRHAYTLRNDLVELVTLPGGGHIAQFNFLPSTGLPTLNPLWVPPWKSMEPDRYRPEVHAALYGPLDEGKLLSGVAGHSICLDYFGPPSAEEAAQGLSTHGEAPSAKWQKMKLRTSSREAALTLAVILPVAGLRFYREIRLQRGEAVAYITETVFNERKADHFFHWTQHVTLGPPFLGRETTRIAIPATKGKTSASAYGNKSLLAFNRNFQWPFAPRRSGGKTDLRISLAQKGLGFVVSALLNPRRQVEFIAALNLPHRLLLGYCFKRVDFPWVAVWEENRTRNAKPWNGRSETRGLEFGSTPNPVPRREAFAVAPLFGTPTFSTVPARGQKTVHYLSFLAQVPEDFGEVKDIQVAKGEILVRGTSGSAPLRVAAARLSDRDWA